MFFGGPPQVSEAEFWEKRQEVRTSLITFVCYAAILRFAPIAWELFTEVLE
ncbi:hypothetical protein DFJ74DRAFT_706538 [Hyaloraphidium curvatum]|nr:hypothetical protein DFJ74DRAFT_706538 [Hyaloraphidium curvatum]